MRRNNRGNAMVSIQSSSYGVSALVSSQMPSATKNAENTAEQNKETGPAEGARPAGAPPPAGPLTATKETAESLEDPDTASTLLETDEMDDFAETEAPTWDEFEAAARFLQDSIDLREEDETAEFASNDSGISFDEAGTYRPAWIK